MQGSVETRSASEAQPEKGSCGASRTVHGRGSRRGKQPVQAGSGTSRGDGAAIGASRVWPPVEPKDGIRCESEVGRRPSQRRDRWAQARWVAAGRSEARNSRRKLEVRSRSSRRTRNRSEPEGWPPVELECRTPTQVGGSVPAQPEEAIPARAGGSATGGAGGRSTGCTKRDQD
jgi:hypothetical protein